MRNGSARINMNLGTASQVTLHTYIPSPWRSFDEDSQSHMTHHILQDTHVLLPCKPARRRPEAADAEVGAHLSPKVRIRPAAAEAKAEGDEATITPGQATRQQQSAATSPSAPPQAANQLLRLNYGAAELRTMVASSTCRALMKTSSQTSMTLTR